MTKPQSAQMTQPNGLIIPPLRYSMVEENLYRGGYPTTKNFAFMKKLKLKVMLSLTPSPPEEALVSFCERENIVNMHIQMPKFVEKEAVVQVAPETMAHILRLLTNPDNFPLYLHCLDGCHNTGLVMMCYRKTQHWVLSAVFSEFQSFTRDWQIFASESEFVENFDLKLLRPFQVRPGYHKCLSQSYSSRRGEEEDSDGDPAKKRDGPWSGWSTNKMPTGKESERTPSVKIFREELYFMRSELRTLAVQRPNPNT